MVSILNKHLQKYLKLLVDTKKMITEGEAGSTAAVECLKNLIEQYQCCRQVNPSQLPSAGIDLKEVKSRLMFKLTDMINHELETLHLHVESLGEHSTSLSQHYDVCMYEYQQCRDQVTEVTKATATLPSIADVMGMCEASERLVRERYLCKLHLIETVDPSATASGEQFCKHWSSGDMHLMDRLNEYMLLCEEFIEMRVT